MNKATKSIIEQAEQLSPEDLAEVVETLHARLFQVSATWEQSWADEADRRSRQLDRGLAEAIDADFAIAEARESLSRRHGNRRQNR